MQNRLQTAKLLQYFQQKLLTENVGSKESLGNKREEIPALEQTVFHPLCHCLIKSFRLILSSTKEYQKNPPLKTNKKKTPASM